MKRSICIIFLGLLSMTAHAATLPLSVDVFGTTFILPLQKVSAVQLYSFRDKKGYPALETVLASKWKWQLSAGAAVVLGESKNVPFASLKTRLSPRFFDTTNNEIFFGAWVGQESKTKRTTWGLSASVPLW